jgi:leucine dehydrogenase
MKAAVRWTFGDASLAGRTIAIQGLGSVGFHLASYLKEEGAKLFGADIDPEVTARAHDELGLEVVPVDEILAVPCDVVAPCALGASLNDDTIPKLRSKIVAGAANNQLGDEEVHGRALADRGILYAPDFVLNAGGLISVYNELLTSYSRERAMRMTRGIYLNMMRVFEIARDERIPTAAAADRVAEERIRKVKGLRSQHWGRMIQDRRTRS